MDALTKHYLAEGYTAGWQDARTAVHELVCQLIQADEGQAVDLIEELVILGVLAPTQEAVEGFRDRMEARGQRIDAIIAANRSTPPSAWAQAAGAPHLP